MFRHSINSYNSHINSTGGKKYSFFCLTGASNHIQGKWNQLNRWKLYLREHLWFSYSLALLHKRNKTKIKNKNKSDSHSQCNLSVRIEWFCVLFAFMWIVQFNKCKTSTWTLFHSIEAELLFNDFFCWWKQRWSQQITEKSLHRAIAIVRVITFTFDVYVAVLATLWFFEILIGYRAIGRTRSFLKRVTRPMKMQIIYCN